ncbi:MAG: hypothetical protein AAB431_00095 [Patescibacteria group bacterium]
MSKHSSSIFLYVAAAIVVIILIVFVVRKGSEPSVYTPFAQCLTEKGTKMYGAWWCPHCTNQKAQFEGAFDKVTYIECSNPGSRNMNQICKDAGIEGFPTWEFADGTRQSGEIPLAKLAEKTGCVLPQ